MEYAFSEEPPAELESLLRELDDCRLAGGVPQAREQLLFRRLCRQVVQHGVLQPWAKDLAIFCRILPLIPRHHHSGSASVVEIVEAILASGCDGLDGVPIGKFHQTLAELYLVRSTGPGACPVDSERAADHFQSAIDNFQNTSNDKACARLHRCLGFLARSRNDGPTALAEFRLALATGPGGMSPDEWVGLYGDTALALLETNSDAAMEEAVQLVETAAKVPPELLSPSPVVEIVEAILANGRDGLDGVPVGTFHQTLAELYLVRSTGPGGCPVDLERAADHFQSAIDNFQNMSNDKACARLHRCLGFLARSRNDGPTALAEFRLALDTGPGGMSPDEWVCLHGDTALALLATNGDAATEEAVQLVETAAKVPPELINRSVTAALNERRGLAYRWRIEGNPLENLRTAAAALQVALADFDALDDQAGIARVQRATGELWLRRSKLEETDYSDQAVKCYTAAQSFYTSSSDPRAWAGVERSLGTALTWGHRTDVGRLRQANIRYQNAASMYESLSDSRNAHATLELLRINDAIISHLERSAVARGAQ